MEHQWQTRIGYLNNGVIMNREDIFHWVKECYHTEPDYPWADDNAVLRHKGNRKWYGVILKVREDKLGLPRENEVDVLNVKCEPMLIGSLRMKEGFFPAYHMNKEHWNTVIVSRDVEEGLVYELIDRSYELTKK